MPDMEIICLANSRKRQARCVAGLRTDGGDWVRPVSSGADGGLFPNQYRLPDGTEPRTLDVISVGVQRDAPKPHQPENWLVDRTPWELRARPAGPEAKALLIASAAHGPELLGSRQSRDSDDFRAHPATASLALVAPGRLQWRVRLTDDFQQQARVAFDLDGTFYDLPLTDPVWEQKLRHLPEGLHDFEAAGVTLPDTLLLTVSLSEPFNGACYKLVAGVIIM